MRYGYPLAIVVLLAVLPLTAGEKDKAADPPDPPDTPDTKKTAPKGLAVNVMSFNIRWDNPKDGDNRWPKRIKMVAEVITKSDADFVGIQEAQNHMIKDLTKVLAKYKHAARSREARPTRGESTPIFYRADRWKMLATATYWLSDTPTKPGSKGWGNSSPRIVTIAKFINKKRKKITVVNTHFDHQSQPSREKSAAYIVTLLAKIKGPVVLTGDFNAGESNAAIKKITEAGYVDTYRQVKPNHRPAGTFNGFKNATPSGKIDYIFVRKGVTTTDADINNEQKDGKFISDHFPVWAKVVFPDKK